MADSDFDPVSALGLSEASSARDLSWIGDFSDELAVAISTREFEAAVSLVERGEYFSGQCFGSPFSGTDRARTQANRYFRSSPATRMSRICSGASLTTEPTTWSPSC